MPKDGSIEVQPHAHLAHELIVLIGSGSEVGSGATEAYLRVLHGPRPRKSESGSRTSTSPTRDLKRPINHLSAQHPRKGVTGTHIQIDQAERDARIAAALLEEFSVPHKIW
jgi:hypothetical protein